MPWVPRGLREGIVTTRYPRQPDDYGPVFHGRIRVVDSNDDANVATAAAACPTGAITVSDGRVQLDRGRCILCGRCVESAPETFSFEPALESASTRRGGLFVRELVENDANLEATRDELARRTRALQRSVHVRHVDSGSDGSDEWEVAALMNPVYDLHRLGVFFTASPRHADVLLVTGAGVSGMRGPLRHTYDVMPTPKVVIAAGVDAISGGGFDENYVGAGGVDRVIPVDVYIPGSPPTPFELLYGILLSVGLIGPASRYRGSQR